MEGIDLTEAVCLATGDKFLLLTVETFEVDLGLLIGEIIGDKSNGLIIGVSRNSGLIAFNCGEAIGEKGFA